MRPGICTILFTVRKLFTSPGDKLAEACAEQTFNRSVTDLLRWIDVVNSALTSDDLGKDVDSVTSLIKKHQLLEVDVQVHKVSAWRAALNAVAVGEAVAQNVDCLGQCCVHQLLQFLLLYFCKGRKA